MPFGKFPVYCQTPSERCVEVPVLLGYYPLNTAAGPCPHCGRFTKLEQPGGQKDAETNRRFL